MSSRTKVSFNTHNQHFIQSTIVVKDQPQAKNENDQKQPQICRICLADEKKGETLTKPCKCSGSLEFVHEVCFIEWINQKIRTKKQVRQNLNSIHCEICLQTLNLEKSKRWECRNKQSIERKIKDKKVIFAAELVSIVITLGIIAVLAYFTFKNTYQDQQVWGIVLGVCWGICALMEVIWAYKLVTTFLIKKQVYVKKVIPLIVESQKKNKKEREQINAEVGESNALFNNNLPKTTI